MHRFQVYDVDKDGARYDTGKTISVSALPTFSYDGRITDRGTIIDDLLNTFGFVQYQYIICYRPREVVGGYNIIYNYTDGGEKPTWYLKKAI